MEYFTNRIVRTQNETEITRVKKLKKKQMKKKTRKNKSFSGNQKRNNFGRKKDKNKIDNILKNMCIF